MAHHTNRSKEHRKDLCDVSGAACSSSAESCIQVSRFAGYCKHIRANWNFDSEDTVESLNSMAGFVLTNENLKKMTFEASEAVGDRKKNMRHQGDFLGASYEAEVRYDVVSTADGKHIWRYH